MNKKFVKKFAERVNEQSHQKIEASIEEVVEDFMTIMTALNTADTLSDAEKAWMAKQIIEGSGKFRMMQRNLRGEYALHDKFREFKNSLSFLSR